jgi:hypothetical protein
VDARRNYPQEPDASDPAARWYQGERGYDQAPDWERRADPYVPEAYSSALADPYRAPEPRSPGYGDPVPSAPPAPASAPPASGPPLSSFAAPTGELPVEDVGRRRAESIDRTAFRRADPPPGPVSAPAGSVYQGKRPGLAALLVALTVIFELPVLRVFAASALASRVDPGGTIAGIFMILGLPTFALGLYGLIGGAAATQGGRAWLRTPLAYLPVGLVLFMAAALAG